MIHGKNILINVIIMALFISHTAHAKECVVLLHGLLRTDTSMKPIAKRLGRENYHVVNMAYPSREDTIQNLSDDYVSKAIDRCKGHEFIHFVTHSMGGILVRAYLQKTDLPTLKNVVMLAPPNQGSEVVDKLSPLPLFGWINGPAGLQLGTRKRDVPHQLGKVNFSLGVIAGNRSVNPILSSIIPGRDDGKVSVKNTKVEGMKDHRVMRVNHTFMMRNKEVLEQVVYFLKNGRFKLEREDSSSK